MADFFTSKKKIHNSNVMKPSTFCVTDIQRCIGSKTSLETCNTSKFNDNASRKARLDFMLNGNGETVFQTADTLRLLPELWAIKRAEQMLCDGFNTAVKNKEGHSANKTNLIPVEYILKTFVINSYDQDLLGNDKDTAPNNVTSDTHHSVTSDTHQNVTKDTHHNVTCDTHHNVISDTHHNVISDTYHTVTSDTHHNVISDTHHTVTSDTHHNVISDTHHNVISNTHHSVISDTHQNVLLYPEVKTGGDVAYQEKDFCTETVPSEYGKECFLEIVEEKKEKERLMTNLPEVPHTQMMQMQAENSTQIQSTSQAGKDHGDQRLSLQESKGRGQGCMRDGTAESLPSDCDGCKELFKDSKQYFRNGDLEKGCHKLVHVLEFKHKYHMRKKIIKKVIADIFRKSGEITTDGDIRFILVTDGTCIVDIETMLLEKLGNEPFKERMPSLLLHFAMFTGVAETCKIESPEEIKEAIMHITQLQVYPHRYIPDSLLTMSDANYCKVIRWLMVRSMWIQMNAFIQKYCSRNGSETMRQFASTVNILEKVIKDKALEDIKLQTVILMLDIGVSLNKYDGKRLAVHATVQGSFKVVVELLKRGCVGNTPMHAAVVIALQADVDNLNLLERLLCQFDRDPVKFDFLNPSQVDDEGNGLFHLLAKCEFSRKVLKAIQMLCARNLDPRVCNYQGKLPVDYIINAKDKRIQFLYIDVSTEVPKLECDSRETVCGANEKVSQMKNEEERKANIRESVKSSTGRNIRVKIEEMITVLKKKNPEASEKPFHLTLQERGIFQAGSTRARTESKLETTEEDVRTSVKKQERSKSENNVDRFVVGANKVDEDKELEDKNEGTSDETIEETSIDASIFDNLAWEVECTFEFWKKMRGKHITPYMKSRIIQRIQLLASGEWQPRLCKRLTQVPPNLQLYELKVSKGGRVIWELAVAFSPRLNEQAAQRLPGKENDAFHPVIGGNMYSEIIRVWDIILDHGKLYRSIQRSAKRSIQAQIIGSYERGLTCIIQKKLCTNPSLPTHTNLGQTVPRLFTETEEDCLDNMVELQQKQLQKYFPPASPNETEYHILKFYSFDLVSQYILQNLSTRVPPDLPFRVTDQEHAIIKLKSDAPILLLGRSGTGKTTCCLYRLYSQFHSYWITAKEADAPILPRTFGFFHHKPSEEVKHKEKQEKMKKKEAEKKEGPVGVDNPEECTCPQYDHIHQVFVTRNPVLCTMVEKKFREFCNARDGIHLDRAVEKLPCRFQDIDESSYPLFLTSHQLLLMLDASIGAPYFFDRKEDYSLELDLQGWMDTDGSDSIQSFLRKDLDSEEDVSDGSNGFTEDEDGEKEMVDIQGWMDNDGSLSILPLLDQDSDLVEEGISNGRNSFLEENGVEKQMAGTKQIKVNPSREVTYEVFVMEVWPQIKKKMKTNYDPSLVWTEIMSVIKGSFEALSKPCGYLSKDEYIEVGRKRAPCFSGQRDKIYKVFTDYYGFIKQKNLFDETDLIHNIFRRLKGIEMIPWVIHQIFVDETQDFTQAELCLLIHICQNPNQMFLTGDTAQSIMRGISFRFEDLKALFFHAQKSMQTVEKIGAVQAPVQYQLTHNYRSHAGILSLASSVLDLLDIFFPESFDKLVRDQGLFNGPQPILFESCAFSDLAVLLRGNRRKTSQIEFGAHQAILVANEAARDAVPEELQLGLILTIYEAKGLEFDDVLLYNFFKDSQASKEWGMVTRCLAKIDQDQMQQERRSRPLNFDYNQHKALNSELKHLYTALTRARVNLWIFDEDVEKRAPMFEYFKAKNLVRCLTLDETDTLKILKTVFVEKSSASDWKIRGDYFMKHNLYEAAAKCYGIGGETSCQKAALAHHFAGKMRGKPRDRKDEFLKAAKLFLECSLPTKAAICLQNARERELAARLYENIGQFEKAAEIYCKLKNASKSSRCYEIWGNYNLAVQVLCKNEQYGSAIDTLQRYKEKRKEYKSKGDQIPQILIDNNPYENFSVKDLNFMLADFHHRHNNLKKMLKILERLPCWEDRVKFLKQKGHVDEAIQILEENGQPDEAVKLLLIYGRFKEAVDSARKTQNGNTIAQTQLAHLHVLSTQSDKKHPSIEDQQQILEETIDLFERCGNTDGSAEANLLLAGLTDRISYVEKSMNLFLESKPNPNLPGMLECVDWIVTNSYITKDNFMSLVQGFDHLFKVVHVLGCALTQDDNELLSIYDSFYGLSTKRDKVIYFPKQKPRCKVMIRDLLTSGQEMEQQVEIELEKKAANERIAIYILNRAKMWLKNALEEVTEMRNEVQQCLYSQVGSPCPHIDNEVGTCLNLHRCHDKRTYDELMEIDQMFIELQRNIEFGARQFGKEKCPKSLLDPIKYFRKYNISFLKGEEQIYKFTSCERIIQDLMPVSQHPHILSKGYLCDVRAKMGIPMNEYLRAFMKDILRKNTSGICKFRTAAAKSADMFLMIDFCSRLFHIDFDCYAKLVEFENALSEEENNGVKHNHWNQLALISEIDTESKSQQRDGKWIVQSLAHRFYDSYFHLTKSDPQKALKKFTKFIALMWKKKKDILPDPKFFLMWLEFYTTLSFFLIAKALEESHEQSDLSFFVPVSYLHLMDFIEATFPTDAPFIRKAVCNSKIRPAFVKKRLEYIVNMLCGTPHSTSLLHVLFSPNLDAHDKCFEFATAERILVLSMTLACNGENFVSEQTVISLIQAMSQLHVGNNCPIRLEMALKAVQKAQCVRHVGTSLFDLLNEREDPFICCRWLPTRHANNHNDHVHSSTLENANLFSADFLDTSDHGTSVHQGSIKLNYDDNMAVVMKERLISKFGSAAKEKAKRNMELGLKDEVQRHLVKEKPNEHLEYNMTIELGKRCNSSFDQSLEPRMSEEKTSSDKFIGIVANAKNTVADVEVQSTSGTVSRVFQEIHSDTFSDDSIGQNSSKLADKNITDTDFEMEPDALCSTQSSPVSRVDDTHWTVMKRNGEIQTMYFYRRKKDNHNPLHHK